MHLDGKILAVTGESTKVSPPFQNFVLCGSGQGLHNSKSMYKVDPYMYDVNCHLKTHILIITGLGTCSCMNKIL